MSGYVVTSADQRTVAVPETTPRAPELDVSGRAAAGSFWERLLHVIGRAVLALPPSTWMLVDIVILLIGVFAAFAAFPPPQQQALPHVEVWQASAVFAFALIISSLVFGLYERETIMSRSRILTRVALTAATTTVLAYAIIHMMMYATVGRRVSALAISLFVVGGATIRFGACWLAHTIHCGLLVIGSRDLFESFEAAQADGLLPEYRLVGYATAAKEALPRGDDPCHLGPVAEKIDELGPLGVTDIVVGDTAARDPQVMEWMVPCLQRGFRVTNEAIFYEKATGQILVDEITPSWFLFADLQVHCDEQASLKRLIDLFLAGIGLCLSAPLWPLIALAIKLCDGGPVFYSQKRVGKHGEVFQFYKFRTMQPDAENGASVWCAPNDPRVTRVGRILRRARLDELHQLYNVLAGQMSVVGPRPERPDIVRTLHDKVPFYAERHLVKPGITGWAQISFGYGASIEDAKRKLQFDLYYLKHMSFELDMIILFRTAGTFLRGGC